MAESYGSFAYYRLPLRAAGPRVIVGVRLKLGRLIDLTKPNGITRQLRLPLDEWFAEDWRKINDTGHESRSQAFGRAAHDTGAEAILAPSARVTGGVNLVYFPDSVPGPGKVEILGGDDLERWLKKK